MLRCCASAIFPTKITRSANRTESGLRLLQPVICTAQFVSQNIGEKHAVGLILSTAALTSGRIYLHIHVTIVVPAESRRVPLRQSFWDQPLANGVCFV